METRPESARSVPVGVHTLGALFARPGRFVIPAR